MDGYSGFGGTSGITPATERVWAVQKKRKTEDHHRRRDKKNDFGKEEKREEEVKRVQAMEEAGNRHGSGSPDGEEEIVYGSGKPTAPKSRKIDLVI